MKKFMQVGTATGRLSSSKPTLQNIPVPKTKDGQEARRKFVGAATAVREASFAVIKHAVTKQFESMKGSPLFRVDLTPRSSLGAQLPPDMRKAMTGDVLWGAYLAAFPPGTNPVYRERTDHDCQCCKSFVRQMDGVVAIVDGKLESIWAGSATGTFYDAVMLAMAELVEGAPIDNLFLHTEKAVGTEKSFQQVVDGSDPMSGLAKGGTCLTWDHFHLRLPDAVVLKKEVVGPKLSEARAAHDVLKRGLEELDIEAVDTVLELIAQNSLYRGEEHKAALTEFRRLKVAYGSSAPLGEAKTKQTYERELNTFVWSNLGSFASRIRNTAVGTLLVDLSDSPCLDEGCPHYGTQHGHGLPLEDAVKKFEAMVAPANYKRPTALVTKAMIEKARKTVEELGLISALERRYAVLEDITVNDILCVDRSVAKAVDGKVDVFSNLTAAIPEKLKNLDRVEEVPVEKFLRDVLPAAKTLEVLLENRHAGNLVSLVAPVDPAAGRLFKWPNGFSWSYAGDVADSVKERVKKAGGSVTGDLCCRLAWDYTDDLDFHMKEPSPAGYSSYAMAFDHIYYGNVRRLSANGGMLDLDANGCDGMKAEPVENIFYADKATMAEGVYELRVNNYLRRSDGKGFEAEVEFSGQTLRFSYDKVLRTDDTVTVAKIKYSKAAGFEVLESLPSSTVSKTLWNLPTQTFCRAKVVMLSPNFWLTDRQRALSEKHGGVGNKHWFFMLDGCRNDGTARGFYNEMLDSRLDPHRKTLEMVGAKMRTELEERQLSGLGFSSTRRDTLTVRVTGASVRVMKVVF